MLPNSNTKSVDVFPVELYPELTKLFQNYISNNMREKFSNKTLTQFSSEYLAFVKNTYSYKYYLSAKLSIKHLVNHHDSEIKLCDITARDIDMFISDLKKNAPKGYLVYYRTLKAAFSKARVWGYIDKNPFVDIKPGKFQRNRPYIVSNNNLKIILSKIRNETVQLIVQTSYYTGCRLSEVLNLRIRNLNINEKMIIVGDEMFTTKSRRERLIPIPDKLHGLLKPLVPDHKDHDFLFPKPNGFPFSPDYISKSFKKAVRKCGLGEGIHFHTLRHSYASNLAANGASPFVLKELLGHSSVVTSEIYTHTQLEDLKRTVNLLN